MFPPRSRNSDRMREEHDIGHHHHHLHHRHPRWLPGPNDSSEGEEDETPLQSLEDWWHKRRHHDGHHAKRSRSESTPRRKKRDEAGNQGGSSGDDEASRPSSVGGSDLSGHEDDHSTADDSDVDQGQPRGERLLSLCSRAMPYSDETLTLESLSPFPDNSDLSTRPTSNADNVTGRASALPPGSGWRTLSDEQTGGEWSPRSFGASRFKSGRTNLLMFRPPSRDRSRFRSARTSSSSVRISRPRERAHARSAPAAAAGLVRSSQSALPDSAC